MPRLPDKDYLEMTYIESSRQWQKRHRKETRKWGRRKGETKADSYWRILPLMHQWKAETDKRLDGECKAQQKLNIKALQDYGKAQRAETISYLMDLKAISSELLAQVPLADVMARRGMTEIDTTLLNGLTDPGSIKLIEDKIEELTGESPTPTGPTLSDIIYQQWLPFQSQRIGKPNGIAQNTFDSYAKIIKHHYDKFLSSTGTNDSKDNINGAFLLAYHNWLSERDDIEDTTRLTAFNQVKTVINWAYENEALDQLPRNIKSKTLTFSKNAIEPNPMEIDMFRRIYEASSERMKMYLLMCLNCGYRQSDLASIRKDEYDIENGTITRKRHKAQVGRYKYAPVVTYKLWEETQRLVEKYKNHNTHEELLFTTTQGNPIFIYKSKGSDTDSLRSGFHRALEVIGVIKVWHEDDGTKRTEWLPKEQRPQIKQIRSTGATLLRNSSEFAHVTDYYLGESAKEIADIHYAKIYNSTLTKALHWMREEIGLLNWQHAKTRKKKYTRRKKNSNTQH